MAERYPIDQRVLFFKGDTDFADELVNAVETKHIHWSQLRNYVVDNPNIMFVLFHFSQRYRDEEITDFFQKEVDDGLKNIYWW